jgi:PAS domain S-box-containing protein
MTDRRKSLKVPRKVTITARLLSYGVALLSVALALGISLPLDPLIKPTPTSLFFVAVMVSAWYGGLYPGLVTTVLSTLAINYCFIPPYYSLKIDEPGSLLRLGVFVMAALLISGLNEARRIALRQEQRLRAISEAAQSEAQAMKERLEMVLSSINDAFFVLDRNWRYIYVNDRYCEMVEMAREALLGQNIWNLFPESVDTDVSVQFQRVMTEHTLVQFEYLYATWNRWYEYRVYPSPDGVAVFTSEISDRKQAEEALRQSEEEFRTISNAAPALVWVCSPNGEIIFFNERWYEFTGQTQAEAFGHGWTETMHPDDAARILPYWQRCQQTGETYEGEVRYRRHDGEYRWHAFRALPRCDANGQIEAWYGLSIDITERKIAEAAVQESERRFRRLVESNMFGVAFGDFTGSFHYVNDYFLKMVGYTREEIETGQVRWTDITPTEFLPLDERALAELRTKGVATPFEKEYLRKDGTRIPILIGTALLDEPYDRQLDIIAFYVDLSDRKQIEAERERLLQREQVAREEAERANRIKDEFLAVLSHELRSPLNPILGWAKLLQSRTFPPDKTAQALATIERNAKLQAKLIEDLLDVSRILRGKMVLNICQVNLVTTIEAAIETVRLAAETKSIQIQTRLDTHVGTVSGDATRLQQIIWNLLTNAVKFTPQGGRVEVRLNRIDSFAQIQVQDTGKGISPEFLPYVFDYFRQENGATTRKFGGLGLGLAIVRHLTEQHGGTIQVDSPGEGLGATFTLRLPLQTVISETAQERSPPPEAFDLSQLKILVVDDEADMRELILTVLEGYRAQVSVAASATEALRILEQTQPDILISDIGMPQMDGYMLMRQVRSLPPQQGGQIRAIALTAYAGDFNQQQALQAGFQQHVSKPVEPGALVRAILSLVNSS